MKIDYQESITLLEKCDDVQLFCGESCSEGYATCLKQKGQFLHGVNNVNDQRNNKGNFLCDNAIAVKHTSDSTKINKKITKNNSYDNNKKNYYILFSV